MQRLGFVEYGIEKNALKHCGKYYDEILMAKELGPPPDDGTVHRTASLAEFSPDEQRVQARLCAAEK